MKKIFVTALAVALMTFGIVGAASAIEYTTTNEVINSWLWQNRTVSWTMDMPVDFEMPYDQLISAHLSIYSKYVDPETNAIIIQVNEVVGSLNKTGTDLPAINWTYLNNDSGAELNLTGSFNVKTFIEPSWENKAPLAVSLTLNPYIDGPAQWYFIEKAVLDLDYENKTAPVPEPGTMALLGFGMLGLAIYGKRRMNRDV